MKKSIRKITYVCQEELIDRLKNRLDECDIRYIIFKDITFTSGDSWYTIYIDKNNLTWNQVRKEVNRIKPVVFEYVDDCYIRYNEDKNEKELVIKIK